MLACHATRPMPHLYDRLDAHFTELGLRAHRGLLRKWRGSLDGRDFEANCSRRSRTRYAGRVRLRVPIGFRFSAQLATRISARLLLVPDGATKGIPAWINRRYGLTPIPVPAELGHLECWAEDRAWAAAVLADTASRRAIADLFRLRPMPRSIALHAKPDGLFFAVLAPPAPLADAVPGWIDALRRLARQVDDELPPPTLVATPNVFERRPLLMGCLLLGGVVALLAFFGLLLVGLAFWLGT